MDAIARDLRYAARMLLPEPGFTLLAVRARMVRCRRPTAGRIGARTDRVIGEVVAGDFFSVLGVRLFLGNDSSPNADGAAWDDRRSFDALAYASGIAVVLTVCAERRASSR